MTSTTERRSSRVLELRKLSDSGFELVLERGEMAFRPGQEIMIHGEDPTEDRTYSIASGTADPDLRVLFRLIPSGRLTPRLAKLTAGDTIEMTGPFGSFILRDTTRPILFIATGTGIAPCASFVRSSPGLNLTLLHGVRSETDLFYRDLFAACTYLPCISQENSAHFRGRVTDRLRDLAIDPDAHIYLCGANAMITDAYAMLKTRGFPDDSLFSEPYYFW